MSLTSLSDLAADVLAGVANALALVGLGLAQLADVGSDLADELLVDALDAEPGRALDREGDAVGGVERDRVASSRAGTPAGSGPWTGRGNRRRRSRASSRSPRSRPTTMLLISVRVRPCSERLSRSSSGRLTSRAPRRPCSTVIGAATVWLRVPLGPLTVTSWPSIGDVDTRRDRDGELANARHASVSFSVSSLPDVGEDFPTHALLVGLAVGQQALARRDDRDAQAAEHLREARVLGVDPQAGLADPADARDGALAVAAVLEGDGQRLADLALGGLRRPSNEVM